MGCSKLDKNITQGGTANSTGTTLEKTAIGTLTSKGFELVNYREYEKNPQKHGNELLLQNVPFKSIYNHHGNTEFLIVSQKYDCRIRIECKWQQVNGSVDEKFPYVYLNCLEAMPENDIIIIVDGGGAKQGAVDWLRKAAAGKLYTTPNTASKNIRVFNISEFIIWVNKSFK